jgi:hypothetical protein
MLRASTLVILFVLAAVPCGACLSWEELPIKLFNDAAVGNGVLGPAMGEAAWLLKSVCVEVEWIRCPVVSVSHPEPCGPPVRAIEIHILPYPMTNDFAETVLGIGFPSLGSRGNAAVFLSRVRQLAASNPGMIDVSGLLGHVLAHEIGHLLLHSSAHSPEGLMRADFRPADLQKAAQRQLKFTPGQAEIIRRNARVREQ